MTAHICISTRNQTINLIPALQMGAEKVYILSSEEAGKQHWTANLKLVCSRKNLPVEIIPISPEEEISPDKMAEAVLPKLKGIEFYWNIGGGKKSMTLGLIRAYQKCARKGSSRNHLIYTENKPYELVIYEGMAYVEKIPMDHFLTIEDILNLYGYTCGGTGERLSTKKFEDWVGPFARYYVQNPHFQEMVCNIFSPKVTEGKNKEPLVDSIRRVLESHRPNFEAAMAEAPDFDQNAKGNIRAAAEKYCQQNKEKRDIDGILSSCNEFYWRIIKKQLIQKLADELKAPYVPLLKSSLSKSKKDELTRIFKECRIKVHDPGRGFISGNLKLPKAPGYLFEDLVAHEFRRVLQQDKYERFLEHAYLGVKTFPLEYDVDGQAIMPCELKANQTDDEFDITMVMPWGVLYLFEVKTHYGEGGDVLKSLRDSASLKSGEFARTVLIDHLLKKLERSDGTFPSYFPEQLVRKRELIQALRMQAWSFDEIASNLPGLLSK